MGDDEIEALLSDPRGRGQGSCPVETAVRALDGKWTMLIVRELMGGARRYGDLSDALIGVSPKTLVERLRYLQGQGVVLRTSYAERPRRVDYRLTPLGWELTGVVREMWRWGALVQQERSTAHGDEAS